MRKHLLRKALGTYLPWYTPDAIEVPEEMTLLAAEYTKSAVRTS